MVDHELDVQILRVCTAIYHTGMDLWLYYICLLFSSILLRGSHPLYNQQSFPSCLSTVQATASSQSPSLGQTNMTRQNMCGRPNRHPLNAIHFLPLTSQPPTLISLLLSHTSLQSFASQISQQSLLLSRES